jgi:hypothetical protein
MRNTNSLVRWTNTSLNQLRIQARAKLQQSKSEIIGSSLSQFRSDKNIAR